MRETLIRNKSRPLSVDLILQVCDTFASKLRGLMGRPQLSEHEGLLFVNEYESILDASIHMLNMHFDIAVIWLNKEKQVVDKVIAKKWRLYYGPHKPAQFFLEVHPDRFKDFLVGDQVEILPA